MWENEEVGVGKKKESSEQPVKNKNRRNEKEHKEKTITLHSVFTNISMS